MGRHVSINAIAESMEGRIAREIATMFRLMSSVDHERKGMLSDWRRQFQEGGDIIDSIERGTALPVPAADLLGGW